MSTLIVLIFDTICLFLTKLKSDRFRLLLTGSKNEEFYILHKFYSYGKPGQQEKAGQNNENGKPKPGARVKNRHTGNGNP